MRAVIDTSVFVSYLLSTRGSGAWLMSLWRDEHFDVVMSDDLLSEIVEVLGRPEAAARIEQTRKLALFSRLRHSAVWVEGTTDAHGATADPKDDMLVSAAIEAQAEVIVTWDKGLIEQRDYEGGKFLSPDEFVSILVRSRPEVDPTE